jgi:hypothetical protein
MAWRPWYHPQLPHTTWGNLAEPQRGQTLRAGASRRQAADRRLRLLDFEVFFFGTAIVEFLRVIGWRGSAPDARGRC